MNDPNLVTITTKNLQNNQYYSPYANSVIAGIKAYNGGSRHVFIENELLNEKISSQNKSADFQEKEYLVQGKNCLVFYGVSISQSPTTWGMCPINSTRAFYFNGFLDETAIRQMLGTLNFLK